MSLSELDRTVDIRSSGLVVPSQELTFKVERFKHVLDFTRQAEKLLTGHNGKPFVHE